MKVAVIGAGPSGLTAVKSCLEEGLHPICFEQKDGIGGLWFYSDGKRHSSVYKSATINTSKQMSCFSDFPAPRHFPPFMHNRIYLEYLNQYARRFDLSKYIRFNTTVQEIKKATDYNSTGRWEVYSKEKANGNDSETRVEIFDAVMVCNGHHSEPAWPSFSGMETFSGLKVHSRFYKHHKEFEGKTVLVIGLGNSAADIAVEVSRHATQVYLSTRRGAWVQSRLANHGIPWDISTERRFEQHWPKRLRENVATRNFQSGFDHARFGLQPEHGVFNAPSVISDGLPHAMSTGALVIKPNISRFSRTGVSFEDATRVENLDAVIFCTGYNISFKFLDQTVVPIKDNEVKLYKHVFPPHHRHPSLAIIGLVQSSGSFNPAAELQARWAVKVFSKQLKLPSREEMLNDIWEKKRQLRSTFYHSKRLTLQVSSISYKDEIADLIGCRPNLLRLFFTNPILSLQCYFGPCLPHQYRLMGPGAWAGAKDAIRESYADSGFPAETRPPVRRREQGPGAWARAIAPIRPPVRRQHKPLFNYKTIKTVSLALVLFLFNEMLI